MITVTTDMPRSKTIVHWQVSKFCEKSCHYCTAYDFMQTIKKDKAVLYHPQEKIQLDDKIVELLPQIVTNGHILLFGGEPTLHPKGIEYFNELCRVTKDNPDVVIFLVTHGDIDESKIQSINTHGKKEHIISISYHHYQIVFEEWLEKVKLWNELTNVLVSSIIPKQKSVWEAYENNMRVLLSTNIPVDIKAELDKKTNIPDANGPVHFKQLSLEATKTHTPFIDSLNYRTIKLDNYSLYSGSKALPLNPFKTFCNTSQYMIADNKLTKSCNEGTVFEINSNTSVDDINNYFTSNEIITCTKKFCTENRVSFPAIIKILDKTTADPEYQEFVQ
jgi:organic radical activating enzyme